MEHQYVCLDRGLFISKLRWLYYQQYIRKAFLTVGILIGFLVVTPDARAQRIGVTPNLGAPTGPPATPTITGPSSVTTASSTSVYTASSSSTSGTSYTWSLSSSGAGSISGTTTSGTMAWTSGFTGSVSVFCTASNSYGSSTSNPYVVTRTGPLSAGTIGSSQSINYGSSPVLTAAAATGGNGNYAYQWQSSATGAAGSWTNITSSGTAQTYSPPSLTTTTWYQRNVTSNSSTAASNAITITVYPQLLPGTITPSTQSALPPAALSPLTCTNATGGYGAITYQWQSSPDNGINDWTNIPNANSTTLILGTAISTTYYRLAVSNNGQTLYTAASSVLVPDCSQLATKATGSNNYIIASTFRVPGYTSVTDAQIAALGVCEVNQDVQYLDGLGRPLQTVMVKASPSQRDMVVPVAYDQYGRESVKYLPYAAPITASDGSYKPTALSDQASFYNNPSGTTWNAPGVVTIPAVNGVTPSSSSTGYEPSPMNRVVEQGAAGAAWQLPGSGSSSSTGNTMRIAYTTNDQTSTFSSAYTPGTPNPGSKMVALYTTNINGATGTQELIRSGSTYYNPGTLYVTVTRDENWQPAKGCLGTAEEYKDMLGHVILRRIYNLNGSTVQMLSTYYIYDNLGNLAFVLPPGSTPDNSGVPSQSVLDNFCYQYNYDGRQRMVSKKIPGKGWEYMIYNSLDQLTATQDSVQRMQSPQQLCYITYDGQGREIMKGIYSLSGSKSGINYRGVVQANVNSLTTLWENRTTQGNGYTTATLPSGYTTLITNYYDNTNIPNKPSTCIIPVGASVMTRGLPIASITAVLNNPSSSLWKVNCYDDLGRVTQIYAQHYLGATVSPYNYDLVASTYNFANQVIASTRQQYIKNSGNTASVLALTIANAYLYDHEGRKKQTYEQINGGTNVLLADEEYNEIGQLMTKNLHSTNSGISYLQSTGYTYNERGWLKTVGNLAAVNIMQVFGEQLQYNDGAIPQYNGNISGMLWQTMVPPGMGLTQTQQSYAYSYDNLNRLILSNYTTPGAVGKFNEQMTYDVMGNITALQRTNTTTASQYLNNFTYDYTSRGAGNQLYGVTDAGTNAQGGTYTYDGNGNVITDTRNKITNISYNLLNLPTTVTHTPGNINYIYNSDGIKMEKVSGGVTRDYIDGIEYNNGVIEFVTTEEGRAIPTGGGAYSYEYYLKDHLGNTRAAVKDDGTIIQVQDYYAFGLEMGNSVAPSPANQYKYSGQDEQPETGDIDFGARTYDPVIGRWTAVDPLAEKSRRWSPYNYIENNPIRNIDPDGMDVYDIAGQLQNRVQQAQFHSFAQRFIQQADQDGAALSGQNSQQQTDSTDPWGNDYNYLQGAELSKASYDQNDPDSWVVADYTVANDEFPNMNFSDSHSGFKSVLYKNNRTGDYIYATAGTDMTSGMDWMNNGEQLGGISKQYSESVSNAKILGAKLGNKLSFTGHSLGGGMAALNAMVTGLHATTFNAAALSPITILRYGGLKSLSFNWRQHVTAYIMTTDPLNAVQTQYLHLQAQGKRIYIWPVTPSGWYNGHSIQNFIDAFTH